VGRFAVRRGSLTAVALVFVVVFAVLESIIWAMVANQSIVPLMLWTTQAAAFLIRLVGIPATVSVNQIFIASRTLEIDLDCTAISIVALYSALVIAYPLPIRSRLLALAVGIPVILVANLLRLVAVAVASEHLSQSAFYFAHDYLFKVAMVLVVVALWASWLQLGRDNAKTA
jgi:exosortase/archaeosortase family protein